MAILEVRRGKNIVGSFILSEDFITVGRSGTNDIVLPDNELKTSRYHAVLLKNPDLLQGYTIRDLSSSWGTNIGGMHIFQRRLRDGDVIQIADFELRYMVLEHKGTSPFNITEEVPKISPYNFSLDIEDQNTIAQELEKPLEFLLPLLASENRILFQELLHRVKSSPRIEDLLTSALDLLFQVFSMNENCCGCFVIFEGEEILKCLAQRGMGSQTSIPLPRLIIQELKARQSIRLENRMWVPIYGEGKASSGFLFLSRGPYELPFSEDEVKIAFFVGRAVTDLIQNNEEEHSFREEEFIKWPRDMIGGERVFREIKRVAPLDVNVLLLGKTGVGKEIAAKEIHNNSRRVERVLRKVNCPNLPKELVESELFGHKKGAFTGAIEDKKGDFELGNGGTIFLDEIADLPWETQRKVLRAIREKVTKRLGEEREIKVDLRIIAATNRDLNKDMEEGKFGSDLYFSFGERIFIPQLNERKRDIPILAHYFLDKFSFEKGLRSRGITPQAMRYLLSYSWPGNIRELENCINQALSKSTGVICVNHLPEEIQDRKEPDRNQASQAGKPKSIDEMEKIHIIEILQYTRWNKERAAEILKISKPTLYSKIKKYGIKAHFRTVN